MKLRVYNKTLDPNLWDDKTLKPEIKESLLKIAEDFYNSTDLKGEIQNILFLGSSANYNWTPTSDIDVHIVIDIAEERINEEYARKFMDGLAFKWNTEHDIEVKGHPVEVYLQDIREPNSNPKQAREGASIYSLHDDKWLLEPNPQNIKLDSDKVRKKFKLIKKKIEMLIQTEDIEKLKELMKAIRNYRDAGLSKGGEFGVENIVFKALRHNGDLKKMKDTINAIYDRKLSLPEEGHVLSYKKTPSANLNEQKKKDFLLVGVVLNDLTVQSIIDYEGRKNGVSDVNHEDKGLTHGVRWRYKSKNNTLYWWPGRSSRLTEKQRDVVLDYLNSKYSVVNPLQSFSTTMYFDDAHKVYENLNKPFLVVGVITDDLSIKSTIDYTGNSTDHVKMTNTWGVLKDVRWRYKSKTNTIYWMPHESEPTTNQREEVIAHLRSKYQVINPRETSDANKYTFDAHTIDEFMNEIIDGCGDISHLFFSTKKV